MNYLDTAKELTEFIRKSPSMFHTIHTVREYLDAEGFTYLPEGQAWQVQPHGRYYTMRNGSSLIAFKTGSDITDFHFQMTAAHSDSPCYKVKTVAELEGPNEYLKLDVEAYGGMIDSTWLDRPLTVGGRVFVREGNGMKSHLLYIDRDILLIPNVAIHFNRQVNDGYKFNRQVDLLPLFSAGALKKGAFDEMVASELGVAKEDILAKDLFLVNRETGRVWGYEDEFVSSPKLDDLECSFASLKAFIAADNPKSVNVYCCLDNEEVGSNTKQGAMSTFLKDTLTRIASCLGYSEEEYLQAVAKSFMVSCDNAHAVHPNHPEKTDAVNCCWLNGGIVIKESANQKYTTDAYSRALFTAIMNTAGVPVQTFANRSDVLGGSTLGNLSNIQVSVNAVDIGLAQLAMHSSFETAGSKDPEYMIRGLTAYFETDVRIQESEGALFE
nr:M18 family aminopeptidase [Faecalibaculum rodentium]